MHQFHHHGYVSGDPRVLPCDGPEPQPITEVPELVDVLIIGAGPAGMATAAQMSMFPDVKTVLIDRRPGRLEIGQADGIQARSVETFQAFGFANRIIEEAYRITECIFWKPDPENPDNIVRSARTPDDPTGISEFPHLIVNQARVLDYFREFMASSPSRMVPTWGYQMESMEVEPEGDHPVRVTLRRTTGEHEGQTVVTHAKYVVGCDGAHSGVRKAIGAQHVGGTSQHAWGVMDVLVNTDFPDIRTKCVIQSKHGSILHIPREGGYLFRSYVDLGEVDPSDNGRVRKTPIDEIIRRCNKILTPYSIDVKSVAWWSVYEVGHRVTDRFDDVPVEDAGTRDPRVFICGDACHTHSAKAGQGMNVSMQDGFNLGWKLGQVLRGMSPASLLQTYTAERQVIAQNLIDFDREWSSRMAASEEGDESIDDFYMRTFEFPAGFMTEYQPSGIVLDAGHQDLATGFPLGKRFKSARVTRLSDTNEVHLGHSHFADGRWRIYVFADAPASTDDSKLRTWAEWAVGDEGPIRKHTRIGDDQNALFDVKVVYQQPYTDIDMNAVPTVFKPVNGPLRLENKELIFGAIPGDDIFEARGISRDGAVVVVRPDQYVAAVLPLDATQQLSDFFDGVFVPASETPTAPSHAEVRFDTPDAATLGIHPQS